MKPLLFATLAFAGSLSIFPCRQTGELPDELAATAGTSDRIKMETFQTTSRTSQTPSKGQGQTTDDTSERHKMTSQEVLQEGKDIGEAASKITTQGRHVLNTYANPGHLYYKLTIPVADTATPKEHAMSLQKASELQMRLVHQFQQNSGATRESMIVDFAQLATPHADLVTVSQQPGLPNHMLTQSARSPIVVGSSSNALLYLDADVDSLSLWLDIAPTAKSEL